MGFFFSDKPKRVTKEEFKEIRSRLYGKLDERERDEVEKLFRSDLEESGIEEGISQAEFDAGMLWLKNNKSKHVLEDSDIDLVEAYFKEHLKD